MCRNHPAVDFPSPTALQEKDDKTISNGNAELDALCHIQDYHHRGHHQAKGNRYGRNEHESGGSPGVKTNIN